MRCVLCMQSRNVRIPLDLIKEIESVQEPRERYGDTLRRIITKGMAVLKEEKRKEQEEFEADFKTVVERVEGNTNADQH